MLTRRCSWRRSRVQQLSSRRKKPSGAAMPAIFKTRMVTYGKWGIIRLPFYFRGNQNNLMYELFFQKFREKVPLTAQEEEHIKSYLTPKKYRKRQYLLQEGD